jgi:inosine-uridine nucleoside N-ribohydrolase
LEIILPFPPSSLGSFISSLFSLPLRFTTTTGYNPNVELIGISTVAGNQSLDKVTDNALRVLSAAGLDRLYHIPLVAGQDKPLMRPPLHCPQIHGESGLDGPYGGPVLPPSRRTATPGKAVLIMFDAIQQRYTTNASSNGGSNKRKVQLVATGALTNVALLVILFPEVIDMIEIVLMGGALGIGNTGPVVEFNIQTDPEAARVVFESGAQVTMVPLEVTHTALATPEVLERINTIHPGGHPFLELIAALLLFFAKTYKRVFKFEDPPLHDPCAVAYVIAPELFTVEKLRVDIETQSELSAGQTVVDLWGSSGKSPNANVCMQMKVDKFWDLMIDAIQAAASASTLETTVQVVRPPSTNSSGTSDVAKGEAEMAVLDIANGGYLEGCGDDEEDVLEGVNGVI